MRSTKFFVCKCQDCSSMILFKVDFLEYNDECCLEFKNHKIMKVFGDEQEAKNYLALFEKEE
ncbi:MAG: hypothetical protein ABIJ34_08110 [archaeon]